MKTIALVSPSGVGHHHAYSRYFAQVLLEFGYKIVLFTPEPGDLRASITRACPQAASRFDIAQFQYTRRFHVPGPASMFFIKFAWVRFVATLIRSARIRPDLVFHTWLDNCLTPGLTSQISDLIFPYPWSGLYFHPWYLRQTLKYSALRRGPWTNHAALRSPRCLAVAVLDEGVASKLQSLSHKPVVVFPDIADDSPPEPDYGPARQISEKARQRNIVGLLGVQSKRKGVLMLMEIARQAAQEDLFFVFAGELDRASFQPQEQQQIAAFAQSNPDNCFFRFERLTDGPQFNAVVNTCDILFAVYQHFLSSSNLLTKAAIFEKPVIVSDAYCMGERVRQFGLGATVDEHSLPQCLEAIRRMAQPLEKNGRLRAKSFETYRRLHSLDQLRAAFKTLLTIASL